MVLYHTARIPILLYHTADIHGAIPHSYTHDTTPTGIFMVLYHIAISMVLYNP